MAQRYFDSLHFGIIRVRGNRATSSHNKSKKQPFEFISKTFQIGQRKIVSLPTVQPRGRPQIKKGVGGRFKPTLNLDFEKFATDTDIQSLSGYGSYCRSEWNGRHEKKSSVNESRNVFHLSDSQ